MKLKFIQKNIDVTKDVEREQNNILYNRMIQCLTELSQSHPETKMMDEEIIREIREYYNSGMKFRLYIEENKNVYAGYLNDEKVYEMYTMENENGLFELGSISVIEDREGVRSEYSILSGLDQGTAKLWLGNYDYNYFKKGEEEYSLR